jgi:hypothetical protein
MVRFAWPSVAVAHLICLSGLVAPLQAQEVPAPSLREAAAAAVVPYAAADQLTGAPAPPPQHRPGALVPLYISFGALQVLDVHSTSRALEHGAGEANPLMKHVAGNVVGMLALKSAGMVGAVHVSERMWKKNRAAALIFMFAANSAMTWVVQHNYRMVR